MGYGVYIFWTAIVRELYNEINNTPIELKSKKLNQYKNFNNYGVFKCKYTNKNSKFKIYLKNSRSYSLPNQARIIFNKNPYITLDQTYPKELPSLLREKEITVQGNLDPQELLKEEDRVEEKTKEVLEKFKSNNHIFNLSHGILPTTKISNIEKVIKVVRDYETSK